METTFTFTMNLTAKTGRITSTEDFAALGFNLSNAAAKILGDIYFNGEVIISRQTVGNPLINLASGATYFDFDLELDNNDEVANGVYEFDLDLRMAPTNLQFSSSGTTTVVAGDGNPEYGLFLEEGDTLTFDGSPDVTRIIDSVVVASGVATYTLTESINLDSYDAFSFDVTHETFSDSFEYSGCDMVEGSLSFTSDCDYGDNGSWSVSNSTDETDATVTAATGTISYPSWTGEDPITISSLSQLPYSNTRLATGTYSANITLTLSQTEDDGLILQYEQEVIDEWKVTCVGSLCGVNGCIQNLLAAHYAALQRDKVSPYQKYVDTVALQYIIAQNYKACGEYDNYQTALAAIQTALDASGCDCDCCDDDNYFWVQNTSTETQTALEEAQAAIVVLQNNSCVYEAPTIIIDDPNDYPTSVGMHLTFEDVSEITIPKEFFDASPNGYATKGVTIEVTTYTSTSGNLYLTNVDTGFRLYSTTGTLSAENYTRHYIKLSTAMYSGIVMCTAFGEAWQLDNNDPSDTQNIPYKSDNYSETLWDLTEDLVVSFNMSETNEGCAISRIRIQAFQY